DRALREKGRKKDQEHTDEDTGAVSSLRLARQHSRAAKCHRAGCRAVRQRNIFRRRDLAEAGRAATVAGGSFYRHACRARKRDNRNRIGGLMGPDRVTNWAPLSSSAFRDRRLSQKSKH